MRFADLSLRSVFCVAAATYHMFSASAYVALFQEEISLKKLAISLTLVVAWAFIAVGATPGAFASTTSAASVSVKSQQVQACGAVAPGYARCMAILSVNSQFRPNSGPAGYHPADLQAAYNLPSATKGNGETVAIVDAYDDPNAEADLGVYRSTFGLSACTTSNGCFKKVNENGGKSHQPRMLAGPRKFHWTSIWSAPSAPTAISCWLKPRPTTSLIWVSLSMRQ